MHISLTLFICGIICGDNLTFSILKGIFLTYYLYLLNKYCAVKGNAVHCTVVCCTVLHWHCITFHCIPLHCTALYFTVPYHIVLYCIALQWVSYKTQLQGNKFNRIRVLLSVHYRLSRNKHHLSVRLFLSTWISVFRSVIRAAACSIRDTNMFILVCYLNL